MASKRLKYGSTSAAITALVVALVVVLNAAITALSSHFFWFSDMTESNLYTLSDEAIALLDQIDAPVRIIFATDADKLENGTYDENTPLVYNTAKQIAEHCPNVTVECHNVYKEYDFFKKYLSTAASTIPTTSVIVESGTEYRLYTLDAFFIFDENYQRIWAYNGENKFVAGMMQVTAVEQPVVCFTIEHGEKSVDGGSKALADLFTDAGFRVLEIDLSKDDIPEDCRIVITNGPVYDFIGRVEAGEDQSANEIAKLDSFLDHYGCYMIFADYDTAGGLRNLSEFLEEWGIKFDTGAYISDYDHSTSVDGLTVVAQYVKDDDKKLGADLYRDIAALETMPKTVMRQPMPINISWDENEGLTGMRKVFPVLRTYDSADTMRDGEVTNEDVARNLMTLSYDRVIINNNYYYSYVLACGSSTFTDDDNLLSQAFANSDILYSAMRSLGKERILNDLEYKAFDKTEVSVTTSQANGWTVALTAILPVIVVVCGVIVTVRRKHR